VLRHINDHVWPIRSLHTRIAALEKTLIRRGLPVPVSLPDFLGIGAPKAGTTWLYQNLAAHPAIYFPRYKEQHYFDRYYDTSLLFYSCRYWRGRGQVKGDITPAYSILPVERIRFIHTIRPDARLIYILRNPIERTWSEAMHNLLRKSNKRRADEVPRDEILATLNSDAVVTRSDYPTNLDHWLAVFPADQLYITFFERIRIEPQALLHDVFDHIGVTSAIDWAAMPFNQRFNVNPPTEIPPEFLDLLRARYCPLIEALYARFGAPVEAWRCM
jgi:hypothetical protein